MTNKRPYWQVAVSLLFSIVATVGVVLIGWKLLGFLMPFVVGWIIASIATPVVNWLEKRLKIRKKLGSALIIIGVLALMGTLGYFAVSWLVSEVSSLIKDFPEMYVQLEKGLHQIGISMSGIFSKLPDGIQNGWTTTVANLDDTMGSLMSKIRKYRKACAKLSGINNRCGYVFLFLYLRARRSCDMGQTDCAKVSN
mgnify:CR=1 FL=1